MNVGELKEILKKYSDDTDIYVPSLHKEVDYWRASNVDSKLISVLDSNEYPNETLVLIIGDH